MFGDASNKLFVSGGTRSKGNDVLGEINKLPSSDMGVLFSPLLRVQWLRRVQARSIRLFIVFKHASNRLLVSGVSKNSPSFPSGFPPPCPIRVQSSHHAGLTLHLYTSF